MSGARWPRPRLAVSRVLLPLLCLAACASLAVALRSSGHPPVVRADPGAAGAAPDPPGSLAYLSTGNVWLLDASGRRQLTSGGAFTAVRWSPGGTYLLVDGLSGPQLLQTDGTLGDGLTGAWLPDDSQVAVASADGGIGLVSPTTRATVPLIPATAGVSWEPVAWSPDGGMLALVRRALDASGGPSGASAWLVQRDGSHLRRLALSGDSWPRPIGWSPDGRWLAVLRGPAENCVSCRVDGQALMIVSADGATSFSAGVLLRPEWLSWAPDSSYLVAAVGAGRETYRNKRLVRLDLPSGRLSDIDGGAELVAIQPAVAPDGAALAYTVAPALEGDEFKNLDAAHGYPSAVIGQRTIALAGSSGQAPGASVPAMAGWTDESPHWLAPNLLLFVRWRSDDGRTTARRQLWLADVTTGAARMLVDDLGDPSSAVGFYGELGWPSLFSWHP